MLDGKVRHCPAITSMGFLAQALPVDDPDRPASLLLQGKILLDPFMRLIVITHGYRWLLS